MQVIFMTLIAVILIAQHATASNIGNIHSGKPSGNNEKLVIVEGHYSTRYDSLEQARLNTPLPNVDKACGQQFRALIYKLTTHCGKVHHQYQCKAIAKAACEPRK